MEARLFYVQRLTAVLMVPLVLGHLILIIWVSGDGLTSAEILQRTRGSWWLALYYGIFVLAVALHAPIGLRAILREWAGWSGQSLDAVMALFGLGLLLLGGHAVLAVTVP